MRNVLPKPGARLSRKHCAFTALELLVTVAVMGIIASIAIPRLSSAAGRSGPAATLRNMASLQQQIEIYAAEHGGVYPGFYGDGVNSRHSPEAFVSQLTNYSDENGTAAARPLGAIRLGPYLRKGMPAVQMGPWIGSSDVNVATGGAKLVANAGIKVGWLYDDTSGEIIPNAPDAAPAVGAAGASEALQVMGVAGIGEK